MQCLFRVLARSVITPCAHPHAAGEKQCLCVRVSVCLLSPNIRHLQTSHSMQDDRIGMFLYKSRQFFLPLFQLLPIVGDFLHGFEIKSGWRPGNKAS